MVDQPMRERGGRARSVKASASVRKREQDHPVRTTRTWFLSVPIGSWLCSTFQEVAGNDEVDALVAQRGQSLAVVQYIDLHQRLVAELGIFGAQVSGAESVQILDRASIRGRKRVVKGPDLDPPRQMGAGNPSPHPLVIPLPRVPRHRG